MKTTFAAEASASIYSRKFQSLSRWTVLIALWVIIFSIAMGKAGIANFMALIRERDVLLATVQELSEQNQALQNTLKYLRSSRIVQERYVKQNFGYLEQDEFVVQFQKD